MRITRLLGKNEIRSKIAEIAKRLVADFSGKEVTFLIVLKGAKPFWKYLKKVIGNHIAYAEEDIKLKSYHGTASKGAITLSKPPSISTIRGREIVIIEDIVDTGRTLAFLLEYLAKSGAKKAVVCSLLSKPSRREVAVAVEYLGFEIEDRFVVGFGMDYDEKYRELPYIGMID